MTIVELRKEKSYDGPCLHIKRSKRFRGHRAIPMRGDSRHMSIADSPVSFYTPYQRCHQFSLRSDNDTSCTDRPFFEAFDICNPSLETMRHIINQCIPTSHFWQYQYTIVPADRFNHYNASQSSSAPCLFGLQPTYISDRLFCSNAALVNFTSNSNPYIFQLHDHSPSS